MLAMLHRVFGWAPVLLPLVLVACTSTAPAHRGSAHGHEGPPAAPSPPTVPVSSSDDAAVAALEARYWARQDSARRAYSQADVDFMDGMIGHHAQALIMSRLAPTNGASRSVQTLAARIINAQQDEIAAMQKWLRDRGRPVPEVHIDGLTLMLHGGAGGHHGHHMMPGMLSDAQLRELAAARGPAFDRLFLTYMIQHHSGAVSMVDDLFATDGAATGDATFKLAAEIHVDQITEIARMRQMLEALEAK